MVILENLRINDEYASLVDPLTEKEYEELKKSIRQYGFWPTYPIVVNKAGVVLDGHHRFKISNELDIKPVYQIMQFDNASQEELFVIDSNQNRRHSSEFQRIELALKKERIFKELAKVNMSLGGKGVPIDTPLGRVDQKIADSANSSVSNVRKVRFILSEADQDDLTKARAGKRKINEVYEHIKENKIRQQLLEDASIAKFQSNVRINGVCLYHGDMITVTPKAIAKNSIGLIFTNPPWAHQYLHLYKELGKSASDVLKTQGHLVTTTAHGNIPQIIRYLEEAGLSYCSSFSVKHSGNHIKDYQKNMFLETTLLLWFVKGDSKKAKGLKRFSNYVDSKKVDKIEHEWQQSTVEARYYIDALTVEGEIVFDPFMGSGTTGIAALRLKRKFIGMEIDKAHYSNAVLRLNKFTDNSGHLKMGKYD